MKRATLCLVLSLGIAVFGAGTSWAEKDYDWKILAAAVWVSPLSDEEVSGETIELSDEVGYELGLEWRATGLLGFEIDYLDVSQDVEESGTVVGEVDMNPISLSANFHLIQGKTIDLWIAPTASYILWDADSEKVDDEFTYGASAGLDIGLGKSFAITGGLRWLDAAAEGEGGEVGVDPLFLRAGVALRF